MGAKVCKPIQLTTASASATMPNHSECAVLGLVGKFASQARKLSGHIQLLDGKRLGKSSYRHNVMLQDFKIGGSVVNLLQH